MCALFSCAHIVRHRDIPRRALRIESNQREGLSHNESPNEPMPCRRKPPFKKPVKIWGGKSPSTAAGEFVREEIDHVREGKHGARSPREAIAIDLSEARRAGIPLKPPAPGKTSGKTRSKAESDYEKGQTSPRSGEEGSTKRGQARLKAMQKEPTNTASHAALSRHAKSVARSKHKQLREFSAVPRHATISDHNHCPLAGIRPHSA